MLVQIRTHPLALIIPFLTRFMQMGQVLRKVNNKSVLKLISYLLLLIFIFSGCAQREKTLLVYAGKGLKRPMEEIKVRFEQRANIKIHLIYAGSATCLEAIKETEEGDVFISGAFEVIKNFPFLMEYKCIALHVPVVAVRKDNPAKIFSFADLARPGVRLGIGNPNMCAIGKAAERIISLSALKEKIKQNIRIEAPTAPELLRLLINKEIDAAIIWEDMLYWPEAKAHIKGIKIPSKINDIKKICVVVLTTSKDEKTARSFAHFVVSEGKAIFKKHGFQLIE